MSTDRNACELWGLIGATAWPPREGSAAPHVRIPGAKNLLEPQTLINWALILDPCQGWHSWSSRSDSPDAARCSGLADSLKPGRWLRRASWLPRGPVPTTPSLTILFAVALSLWPKPKTQTLKVQSPLPFPLPFTAVPGVSEQGLGEIPARHLPLHVI